MRRYLVVANQTLGGEQLRKELQKRTAEGPSSFYVLVPNTRAAHYHVVPAAGGLVPMPTMVGQGPETDEEATAEAQDRLARLLAALRGMGVEAEGHLCGPHPFEGVEEAFAEHAFDEVIVSALPRRVSRWLQSDLPHRIERRFDVPVTTVARKH